MAAPPRRPPLFSYKYRGVAERKKKRRPEREGREEKGETKRGKQKREGREEKREKGIEEKTKGRRRSSSREENEKTEEREKENAEPPPATPLSAPFPVATSSSAIDDSHHRSTLYPLSCFTVHLLACRTCTVHVLQAMN